jgi:hypothetical protein
MLDITVKMSANTRASDTRVSVVFCVVVFFKQIH